MSQLLRPSLGASRRAFAFAGIGILFGTAAFAFFIALGGGVRRAVVEEILQPLPQGVIEVRPKGYDLGMFQLSGRMLGGGLDDDALARLQAIPGVAAAHPVLNLAVPVSAKGELFGRLARTDLIITGLAPEVVADELSPPQREAFQFREEGPIPVLVSRHLLELYNNVFAAPNQLPRLSDDALVDLPFTLVVGRSYLAKRDGARVQERAARVVGVSKRAVLVGATLPIEYVRRFNAEGGKKTGDYASAWVVAEDPSQSASLTTAIEAMQLEVDQSTRRLAQAVSVAVMALTVVLGLSGVAITAVAALAITLILLLLVRERRSEIGILRAVGARQRDIRRLFIQEAALVGAAGGALGLLLAFVATVSLDAVAGAALPELPYKPTSFFDFSWWLWPLGLLLSTGLCVLGARVPAGRAAAIDPARALSGS